MTGKLMGHGKGGHDLFLWKRDRVPLFRIVIVSLDFQREGIKLIYGQELDRLTLQYCHFMVDSAVYVVFEKTKLQFLFWQSISLFKTTIVALRKLTIW